MHLDATGLKAAAEVLNRNSIEYTHTTDYSIKAPTALSFVKEDIALNYGLFDFEESRNRIYERKPVFDNNTFYGTSDSIQSLASEYFAHEPMIENNREYVDELTYLSQHADKFKSSIKAILVIPAYMEENVISNTLSKYAACHESKHVAIVILENHVESATRDNTWKKISEFESAHSHIQVIHLYKTFAKRVPIGFIRKYLCDFAVFHSLSSGLRNPILIGGDADCEEIDSDYLHQIIKSFTDKHIDAVEMKMDFPKEYFFRFPNLWIVQRFFDYTWKYIRNKINSVHAIRMYGPAGAIKMSSYIQIGGHNPRASLCEDLQLSWLLDQARRDADLSHSYFKYNKSKLVTNPRRSIATHAMGLSHSEMYSNFEEDESIRNMDWYELAVENGNGVLNLGLDYTAEEILAAMENGTADKNMKLTLQYELQDFLRFWQYKVETAHWMSTQQFDEMFRRVSEFIGLRAEIDFEGTWKLRIRDYSKLVHNLQTKIREARSAGISVPELQVIHSSKRL